MLRLFRQYYPIHSIFFILVEGVLIYGAVLTGAFVSIGPAIFRMELWFYAKLSLITVVCQACLYFNELYDLRVVDGAKELGIRLLQSFGSAGVFLGLIFFVLPETIIGTTIFMKGVGLVIILIACWRFLYALALDKGILNQKIILLGSGDLIRRIREEINSRKDCGYSVAIELPESLNGAETEHAAEVQLSCMNKFEGLCELGCSFDAKKIVVGFLEKRCALPVQELLRCRVEGMEILEANSFYEMLTGKLLVESINPGWLIFSRGFHKSRLARMIKRTVDIFLAASLLVLFSPVFILAAGAIRLDTPGPSFFTQQRVGERRRIYRMHKFRSMVQDAEMLSGPVWAEEDDPRITRVGRVLRRLRIDELPQLWNVLKGEMSFVGPRPERDCFVRELDRVVPYYGERFLVKPGISGWAQVNYGYGASVQDAVEKLNYDLFYVKNMSILIDFLVMLKTIRILIFGYGVH
jgi:sugar transferase (PEP-CTERM system associated)